jgi:hypothetical protein
LTTLYWKDKERKLITLANRLQKQTSINKEYLRNSLVKIFPETKDIMGVDARYIAFLEFCFYRANGPYSMKFKFYVILIRKIFKVYPPALRLINSTGASAIANMALGGQGGFKFEIADQFEFEVVLKYWRIMGLKRQTSKSVFNALMRKNRIKVKIKDQDLFLLARLKEIFPTFKYKFIKQGLDLNQALYEHFKERFESIIQEYEKKGLSLQEMIDRENKRELPVGVKRNNLLAFLVKKIHNFECQVCNLLDSKQYMLYEIQAHHIKFLSQEGLDHSKNMIILCEKHHDDAHSGKLTFQKSSKLQISYRNESFSIDYN